MHDELRDIYEFEQFELIEHEKIKPLVTQMGSLRLIFEKQEQIQEKYEYLLWLSDIQQLEVLQMSKRTISAEDVLR